MDVNKLSNKILRLERLIDKQNDILFKYSIRLEILRQKYKEQTKPGFKLSYQMKQKTKSIKLPYEIQGINISSPSLINTND